MEQPESPLEKVQRWMQSVIMHPEGVEAGLDSETARKHINVSPEQVEQVISPSQALSSVERLAIYANAYYARLLECLGEEFPVLKQTSARKHSTGLHSAICRPIHRGATR